ncbi:MAG: BON domain-containing protein [Pseudomonadota bacterium]
MRIVSILFLLAVAGALQGCFPVVAAGVGTGVMVAEDRRTSGIYLEDEVIESKVNKLIRKQFREDAHINVTSYNRNVLLTGEVPSEAVRTELGKLAAGIENVRNVYNDLVVSGVTSLTSRSSDSLITSNVKVRFVGTKAFKADHVKVVTENGTVFLLGIVYRAEAEAATELASTTGGVQRVVRLFEYLD